MASHKKRASQLGAHIVFLDESGFRLTATVCRTWAPRGRPPVISYRYRHDKISVISALSVSPRLHRVGLYYAFHEKNIQHAEVCAFLRQLLRHLRGPVVVIWDNGRIHRGEAIRNFVSRHARLQVEFFPGYAPELNPDEWVWSQAKQALANSRPDNTQELSAQVVAALERLRGSPASLRSCIHRSDLPSFL